MKLIFAFVIPPIYYRMLATDFANMIPYAITALFVAIVGAVTKKK